MKRPSVERLSVYPFPLDLVAQGEGVPMDLPADQPHKLLTHLTILGAFSSAIKATAHTVHSVSQSGGPGRDQPISSTTIATIATPKVVPISVFMFLGLPFMQVGEHPVVPQATCSHDPRGSKTEEAVVCAPVPTFT